MPIQHGRNRRRIDYRAFVPDIDGRKAKSERLLLQEASALLGELFITDRNDRGQSDDLETIHARTDAWGVVFSLLSELQNRDDARRRRE